MSGPTAEDGIERQLLGETSEIDNLADHSLSREFDRNRANFANRHRTDHVHLRFALEPQGDVCDEPTLRKVIASLSIGIGVLVHVQPRQAFLDKIVLGRPQLRSLIECAYMEMRYVTSGRLSQVRVDPHLAQNPRLVLPGEESNLVISPLITA